MSSKVKMIGPVSLSVYCNDRSVIAYFFSFSDSLIERLDPVAVTCMSVKVEKAERFNSRLWGIAEVQSKMRSDLRVLQ